MKNDFDNTSESTLLRPYARGFSRQGSEKQGRPLISFRVGAITEWVRDILMIVLLCKLIAIIY